MIGKILMGIMSLIISLVNVLLAPIDALIASALPNVSAGLTFISNMFDLAGTYVGFIVNWTFITNSGLTLIFAYYSFILTYPLAIATIKLAIKWYDKLKP